MERKKIVSTIGKKKCILVILSLLLLSIFTVYFVFNLGKNKGEARESSSNDTQTEKAPLATDAYILLDVPLLEQMSEPRLYNGCEVTSLAMLLNYHNFNVSKDEIANSIKKVPMNYENGQYGNPNTGFVGELDDGEGYSVYHGPIAQEAKKYISQEYMVEDLTNEDFTVLLQYLFDGYPIWVIVTVPMAATDDMETWETPTGEVEISWNVHSVVMTGFDEDTIYVNDPYGEKDKEVDRTDFQESWEQMGSQAVTIVRK